MIVTEKIKNWADRVRTGDLRALARAITAVENRSADAAELLKTLFPHSGTATVIGVTGAPGAGKSTLVDGVAREYRKANKTVGIVAIDPTSPFTGGAILGDRIRMQGHYADPGIFIRSMATRGSLGGLARTTADVTSILDASGRDLVLVETVGVGQDEIDIVKLADVTIVVLVPGMGDDVQSIKAGIMEIADIFVINKSDRDGAERVEREIRALQGLALRHDDWVPPIVKTVAANGDGIPELVAKIEEYRSFLDKSEAGHQKRIQNWRNRLVEMLRDALLEQVEREHPATARPAGMRPRSRTTSATLIRSSKKLLARLGADSHPRAKRIHCGVEMFQIDHLGIAVKSLDKAKQFYETLGMQLMPEETVADEKVRLVMVPLDGSRIELLEPTESDSPIGRFLEKRGEGLHHVALQVEDIAGTVERLKAAGTRFISDEIKVGAGGHLYVFVHPSSAGGVLVELCEDPPTGV